MENNVEFFDTSNQIDALKSILTSDDVVKSIRENIDILLLIIPEIKVMIGFDHMHPHHHLDVWEHTLCALSFSENDFETRLAILLHDIGKPASHTFDGEFRHYPGHERFSKEISQTIFDRLGLEKSFSEELLNIIESHDEPLTDNDIANNRELSNKIFKVQICDCLAHNPEKNEKRLRYINQIKSIFNETEIQKQ